MTYRELLAELDAAIGKASGGSRVNHNLSHYEAMTLCRSSLLLRPLDKDAAASDPLVVNIWRELDRDAKELASH